MKTETNGDRAQGNTAMIAESVEDCLEILRGNVGENFVDEVEKILGDADVDQFYGIDYGFSDHFVLIELYVTGYGYCVVSGGRGPFCARIL